MSKEKELRWILADDHTIIKQAWELIIKDLYPNSIFRLCKSLLELKEVLAQGPADYAIFDAQFPDGNLLQILPDISQNYPDIKILIFSSFDEATYAVKFVHSGAHGFLSKLSEEPTLSIAVQQLVEHGEYLTELTKNELIKSLKNPEQLNPITKLTERELEVAIMYAKGWGNLEVANQLGVKQNTVSTLKKRIFEKLNLQTNLDLINFMKREYFLES